MLMDNIKLFAKNETELETLKQTVRIYSRVIAMEFCIEKCVMLLMKSGKRHMTKRFKLANKVIIRTVREKETHKKLMILEADTIKQEEMKEKN